MGPSPLKFVKEIKQLLLASLPGNFVQTLMAMSDEEVLRIFEEIQNEEGKKISFNNGNDVNAVNANGNTENKNAEEKKAEEKKAEDKKIEDKKGE